MLIAREKVAFDGNILHVLTANQVPPELAVLIGTEAPLALLATLAGCDRDKESWV